MSPAPDTEPVTDPGLHLLVDGVVVHASRAQNTHLFRFTAPASSVRLGCRAVVPHRLGLNDDRRLLGFAVQHLAASQGGRTREWGPDSEELFDGFHDCEPEGWRWTNGNAALPHSLAGADGPVEVRVSGFGLPHYGFVDPAEEADRRLFLGFESLGENCEFGFAQRQYGAEPVSLLRWASTSLAGLEAGLASGFAGLGDAACTHLDWSGETHEYQMRDPRFFGAHTAIGIRCADAAAEAALRDRIAARLKLLRRKLLADIASDARIFVFKARDPAIGLAEFRRLHGRLRSIARAKSRIGPPTRLLCVRAADAGERPGVVRDEGGELLLGTIDRFVPIGGSYAMWRTLCIAAHEIAGRA